MVFSDPSLNIGYVGGMPRNLLGVEWSGLFGRLTWLPEVGLVAWSEGFVEWVERLNAKKNGGEYRMIEVQPAGSIDGLCSDNTFGIKIC